MCISLLKVVDVQMFLFASLVIEVQETQVIGVADGHWSGPGMWTKDL